MTGPLQVIHNHPPLISVLQSLPLQPLKNPSPFFTGQKAYLQILEDFFNPQKGEMNPGRKSFLLYGMGGIGKTQICLKFIQKVKDWYAQPNFFQTCDSYI